jgi:hypothetical protein
MQLDLLLLLLLQEKECCERSVGQSFGAFVCFRGAKIRRNCATAGTLEVRQLVRASRPHSSCYVIRVTISVMLASAHRMPVHLSEELYRRDAPEKQTKLLWRIHPKTSPTFTLHILFFHVTITPHS